VEAVGFAEADAAAGVAERCVERAAGVHDRAAVLEQDLAREDARRGTLRRSTLEGRREPRLRNRVVVQQENPVRAPLERPADAGVVTAREAAVLAEAQELDVGKALFDLTLGAVGRAVVDADRVDARERRDRARSVVAAVPVEDDREEPHRSVRA
jgi:hypothetical protein